MKKTKKLKDGKTSTYWLVCVDLPRGGDGKRRQKRERVRGTKRQAEERLRELLTEIQQNGYVAPERMTVGEYLDRWLETQQQTVRETTVRSRKQFINRWRPLIGPILLTKLTTMDLQISVGRLSDRLAPNTKRRTVEVLHTALKQAVSWGLIPKNPLQGIQRPRSEHKEMRVWTEEQATAFLDAIRHRRAWRLFHVALFTGMRQGELLALAWDDVDFQEGIIHVRRSLAQRNESGRSVAKIQEPKTRKSRRQIPLDSNTLTVLKVHRHLQLEGRLAARERWQNHDLVFCTRSGKHLTEPYLRQVLQQGIKTAMVPAVRFHDLRHTHATLLLARGVHIKVVAERLGHSNVAFTMQTYAHVLPGMQQEAVRALEGMFGK